MAPLERRRVYANSLTTAAAAAAAAAAAGIGAI